MDVDSGATSANRAVEVAALVELFGGGNVPRTVVLVEGVSDQFAVEALARRRGRNFGAEGIVVVPIGGATNIEHFLDVLGPRGFGVKVCGLCDAAEETGFRRGLERAGFGTEITRTAMEQLGFYVCVEDLEDELIRSIRPVTVETIIEGQGELGRFRSFQNQPAWRGRPVDQQLRRFMGTRSGRKIQYSGLLVEAMDLTSVPYPLEGLLAHV